MKNRKSILVITLVLAMTLLVATAYAATPANAGYEALKDVLKNHQNEEFDNGTVTGTIEIIDNGETVLSLEGNVSGDEGDKEFSGELKLITENLEKELSINGLDEMIYIADLDTDDVYVAEDSHEGYEDEYEGKHNFDKDHDFSSDEEAIMDYFVGDLANEFELVNSNDGSFDVKLELTKNEMPTVLNLLASADSDERHNFKSEDKDEFCEDLNLEDYPLFAEIHNSKFELTELVDDVEVEYLMFTIHVDSNKEIKGLSFEASVSGVDENSENHTITVKGNMVLSNVGNAKISTMDLTGKNIIELPECEDSHFD